MCISDIRVWLIKKWSDLSISVGDTQVSPSKIRDLGIDFDQYLIFQDYISGMCKSTHFRLYDILACGCVGLVFF